MRKDQKKNLLHTKSNSLTRKLKETSYRHRPPQTNIHAVTQENIIVSYEMELMHRSMFIYVKMSSGACEHI